MPFELENTKREVWDNLDWLYMQEYEEGENHVTEALFKWFFFSTKAIQKRFLSRIFELRGERVQWKQFNLQVRRKRGTPDAVLRLADDSKLLFEVKIRKNAVSRQQLKRHLRDAGLKSRSRHQKYSPKLVLITPDYRPPKKLDDLPSHYRDAILWLPWTEVIAFLSKELRGRLHSSDRMLRDGLLLLLKKPWYLEKYLP